LVAYGSSEEKGGFPTPTKYTKPKSFINLFSKEKNVNQSKIIRFDLTLKDGEENKLWIVFPYFSAKDIWNL
jgi:hypothetical protein